MPLSGGTGASEAQTSMRTRPLRHTDGCHDVPDPGGRTRSAVILSLCAAGGGVRVLHVLEAAGAGTLGVVTALVERLDRAGHEVTLAIGHRPETPADLDGQLPAGVQLVHLPWVGRTWRSQPAAALALRRLVDRWQPDVVHLHSSIAGAVGSVVRARCATVYTPHGYAFSNAPRAGGRMAVYRWVERLVARRSDMVVAVSEAEGALARDVIGAPRLCVIPNGIPELDDRASRSRSSDRPMVVGLGRIVAARSPQASARVLAAVASDADVAWIGASPGDEHAPLAALGIPITGWLAHDDAVARLADATVLVHWSSGDGASLAVLEAMAVGTVVVASDIPANRELLGPRQVVASERDAVALVRAVLADERLRSDLVDDQRRRAASYGANLMASRYAHLYRRLLATDAVGARAPARAAG
jgi:glycosyltransferase involved in cell wall biosynthesis